MLKARFSIQSGLSQLQLLKLRTLCHILIFLHHFIICLWFFIFFNVSIIDNEKVLEAIKVSDKYLTIWNTAFEIFYYMLALYCDYLESKPHSSLEEKHLRVMKFRDVVFSSIVFPIGMFVCTIFWLTMFLDREMLIPSEFDKYVPMWVHHSTHTWVVAFVLLEILIQPRIWQKDDINNLLILTVYNLIYTCVFFLTYVSSGKWVYPVYGLMTWWQQIGVIAVLFGLTTGYHYLGWWTNDFFWKNSRVNRTNQNGIAEKTDKIAELNGKYVQNGSVLKSE